MKIILLIEDDENLTRGISYVFEKDGFHVLTANSLKDANILLNKNSVELILLDIGLPDGNGIDFCKVIRTNSTVPIIILTACDMEIDEVSGLMAGADDYITKPFSLSVLRARVTSLLRRFEHIESNILNVGNYSLNLNQCTFFQGNEEIEISATEYKLLHLLMSHAGQVLSKEQIISALWDNHGNFVDENTLPVNISRLRAKIENDPKKPQTIKTIFGLGYLWAKEV
jgi:DNA-binding response OmpR family regulator